MAQQTTDPQPNSLQFEANLGVKGIDASFQVVEHRGQLMLLIDAKSLYNALHLGCTYLDWINAWLQTCGIALDEGYFLRPHDGQHFLTISAFRTIVQAHAHPKSPDILTWLDACEERLAPQLLGATEKALQGDKRVH